MTSRPSHTKRPSAAAPVELAAKPPCRIHPTAIIADKASITGTHTFELGENSVVHPHAKIQTGNGAVTIGRSSTVCETAVVGSDGDIHIGDGVSIESGAIVEAKSIGDGTVIETKVKIGRGATIGKYCKISPLNVIKPGENLPDYTVVYGDNQRRFNQTMASNPEIREAKRKTQELHVQLLRKLIPDSSAKYA